MFSKLLDFFVNAKLESDLSEQNHASSRLTHELRQIFLKKIHEFSDLIEERHHGLTSLDMNSPGPYFIAYYEWHSPNEPHLHYEFSFIKSVLEKKKASLSMRGIFATVQEIPISGDIPYLGEELDVPKKP